MIPCLTLEKSCLRLEISLLHVKKTYLSITIIYPQKRCSNQFVQKVTAMIMASTLLTHFRRAFRNSNRNYVQISHHAYRWYVLM